MRNGQNAVLASLRRSQQFLDVNADSLGAVNTSTRKQLDDVVTQLSNLSISQEGSTRGSKGETARLHASLLALRRNYMAPIAELAKLKLRDVPEFAALMLPPANATADRAVAAAYAMADAATEHAPVLLENGLPTTFADDLRTAAAAVSASTVGRSAHQGRRSGATAGLAAEERRGRAILRVLNALIMARVGSDAQLVAEWTTAKAVRRKPGPVAGSQASDAPAADSATTLVPTVVSTLTPTVAPPSTPTPAPTPAAHPVAVAA
jgi:hypothetical protein